MVHNIHNFTFHVLTCDLQVIRRPPAGRTVLLWLHGLAWLLFVADWFTESTWQQSQACACEGYLFRYPNQGSLSFCVPTARTPILTSFSALVRDDPNTTVDMPYLSFVRLYLSPSYGLATDDNRSYWQTPFDLCLLSLKSSFTPPFTCPPWLLPR